MVSFEAMPLYEYQCDACQHRFERIQKFSDPPVETCPLCGGTVHKMISSPAFHLKGSGWYATDYAKKSEPSKTSEGSTGDSKDSTAKDGKESKESKESKEGKDSKESSSKDSKESKESKESKDTSSKDSSSKDAAPAPSKSSS
jgi:putative FmdB family regulatory protein